MNAMLSEHVCFLLKGSLLGTTALRIPRCTGYNAELAWITFVLMAVPMQSSVFNNFMKEMLHVDQSSQHSREPPHTQVHSLCGTAIQLNSYVFSQRTFSFLSFFFFFRKKMFCISESIDNSAPQRQWL
jgi:hypothetical protein